MLTNASRISASDQPFWESDAIARAYADAEGERRAQRDFFYRFGYENRITDRRIADAARARAATQGEAAFTDRDDAAATAADRLNSLAAGVAEVNLLATHVSIAEPTPHRAASLFFWYELPVADAASFLETAPRPLRNIVEKKRAHDEIARRLELCIRLGQTISDFAAPRDLLSMRPCGHIEARPVELSHSRFGRLARLRDGRVHVVDGAGREIALGDGFGPAPAPLRAAG